MKDRCRKRYSVYDAKTEMPIVIYGTARECAEAMGITLNSFHRCVMRTREGKIHMRKWEVCEDEVEELEEEVEAETTLTPAKPKRRTHFARIIVDGTAKKPYYNILYFDPADNEYHIGYGSRYLRVVFRWLREEFEIVEEGEQDGQ